MDKVVVIVTVIVTIFTSSAVEVINGGVIKEGLGHSCERIDMNVTQRMHFMVCSFLLHSTIGMALDLLLIAAI